MDEELIKKYIKESNDPKKPKIIKRKGKFTKKFIKWNKKLIKENKTTIYFPDPEKLYIPKTKKLVKKSKAKKSTTNNLNNPTINSYFTSTRKALINRTLSTIDLTKISLDRFMELTLDAVINPKNKDYHLVANVQGTPNWIALSETNIKRLSSDFDQDINDFTATIGSDVEFLFELTNSPIVNLVWELRNKTLSKMKKDGAFFKYYHNLKDFDLSRFGLYSEKPEEYVNCLFTALKEYGVPQKKLNTFISIMGGGIYIPCNKLSFICQKLNIHIMLRIIKNSKTTHYGNKKLKPIKIGLIKKHFFLIDRTPFTKYSLKNYEEIKDIKDWNNIKEKDKIKGYKKDYSGKTLIDSFNLYKFFLDNEKTFLSPIPAQDILETQYHDMKIEDGSLKYDDRVCCAVNEQCKTDCSDYYTIFFDFETITEGEKHVPYLMCAITEDDKKISAHGFQCGKEFLKQIANMGKKKILLVAHNTRYDYTFLMDYLYANNPCLKGNRLMTGSAKIFGKNGKVEIKFQDTLNFLVCPLSKFPKMFGIKNVVKEVIPYHLYTQKNVDIRYLEPEECYEVLKNEKLFSKFGVKTYNEEHLNYFKDIKKTFIDNATKWGCFKMDKIDIVRYSRMYCNIDCEILKKSYCIFRDWMLTVTELDLKNYCSIASMSLDYLIINNVFDGCYKLAGTPQQFIQKCVVGGRVMLSHNEKKIRVGNIADFDAVAEYPSAMFRMEGILKGKPKVIENKDLNWLMKQDGFFIKCICKNTPTINRAFPCLSLIDDDTKSRNFTNNIKNEIFYLDKTSYEDCVKFQGLEFEVLSGYYYNEGRNPKLKKVIKHLFDTRIKAKNEIKDGKPYKNPIEQVYKLLMNSCYGKCLLKPITTEKVIKTNKQWKEYKERNFNYIQSYIELKNSKLITQVKPINEHFNNVYAGVEILSMSKRILGEVLYCAEDNDIEIFYVDTDSTHIFNKDIEKLGKKFKEQYNRELLGEGMGQFNTDFDLDGCKDVYSSMFIGLAKKCYLDCLVGTNKNTGKTEKGFHARMKGMSKLGIEDYNLLHNQQFQDTYLDLYFHKKIPFDMVARGRGVKFHYNPDMTVSNKSQFVRNISFPGKIEDNSLWMSRNQLNHFPPIESY